jgi:hypothetical protein
MPGESGGLTTGTRVEAAVSGWLVLCAYWSYA